MLKKLKLTNFRKFDKREFEFTKPFIIFYGPNAVGKTSILEAISIISNGTSGWTSDNQDIFHQKQENDKHYRLEADVNDDGIEISKAIFQSDSEKIFFMDGKKTSKKKYLRSVNSNIFSPEVIELLMISPQDRRDFLDKFISNIDPDYAENLTMLTKSLRHRNSILKKLAKDFFDRGVLRTDDAMLKYWTELVAKFSTIISNERKSYIKQLKSDYFSIKYKPSIIFSELEQLISEEDGSNLLLEKLQATYKRDIVTGRTNLGAHRDDWDIIAKGNMRKFGSRGEKRLAITRLLMRIQDLTTEYNGIRPYFLIDDLPSELDETNKEAILEEIYASERQAFLTTIKLDDIPKRFLSKSQKIKIG